MKFGVSANARNTSLLAAVFASAISIGAQADDIDVYKASVNKQQKPNILFVLDYSGSMGWDTSGVFRSTGNGPSRISVLKSAMNQILDDNAGKINAGLGSMFNEQATGISWPISDLNADANGIDTDIPAGQFTVKDIIKQRVEERNAGGSTATVDALVEAAQYFRGDPVTHSDSPQNPAYRHRPSKWNTAEKRYTDGDYRASLAVTYSPSDAWSSNTSKTFYCNDYSVSGGPDFCEQNGFNCETMTANDPSTPGFELQNNLWGNYERCEYARSANSNWETPRFNSPISDRCEAQNNAIVLITDGEPTVIKKGASLNSLVGSFDSCEDLTNSVFGGSTETANQGNCGIEIVHSLATEVVNPAVPKARVKTYSVGFNINEFGWNYLKRLTKAAGLKDEAGREKVFRADTPEELNEALAAVVRDISSSNENFSGISVEVDKSSFSHKDRVFYSLFSPSKRRSWQGNLKGYFVGENGLEDINGTPAANDNQFAETAQSFWSPEADGNNVQRGGASAQLQDGNRNLYTYLGNNIPTSGARLGGQQDTTRLRASNTGITKAMMGLNDDADTARKESLDWIQTAPMGDPLHTSSVSVDYGTQQVVYIMTNQGFLHAIDASAPTVKGSRDTSGGNELFAFMPQRLLKNLNDLRINNTTGGHIYGLDGAVTRWHDDTDNDGIVDTGESVMLYFGMRRGGNAYYAMDVSKPQAPVLKWVIDDKTPGFEKLAQSWSRMSLIKVTHLGKERRVLAFAGGFDAAAQDDVNAPVASKGNTIFMVSESGKLLWHIDADDDANMKYSIPSDLTLIDSDGDSRADRLYVGDLGGQLWRVDFDDIAQKPAITRLANLADAYHQPFFYPPSVALNGQPGTRFLSVTIGSGNRTDPLLSDVKNNFYMIRDTDVDKGKPAESFSMVTPGKLYDATENAIQSDASSVAKAAAKSLKAARGWRIQLPSGEKSLSTVLTYEGKVMATTYKPDTTVSDDICSVESTGVFYVMDVNDATVIETADDIIDDDAESDYSDDSDDQRRLRRTSTLKTQGIPSSPIPLLVKGTDSVQIFVDKVAVDEFKRTLSRVYWHAR